MSAAATVSTDPALDAIVRAMARAGCSDQQIGAVCRELAGVEKSFMPPSGAARPSPAPPPWEVPPQPSQNETVAAADSATISPDALRPRAEPRAAMGDPRLMRAALMRMPGLSAGARRVGEVIIDHYNRQTGRCDPSIARISGLSGLSRATVFRAVAGLEAAGLFVRRPYGGMAHCNAYEPQWQAAAAAVSHGDKRNGGGAGEGRAAPDGGIKNAGGAGQPSQNRVRPSQPPSQNETQTLREIKHNPFSGTESERGKAVRRHKPPDPRQPMMPLPIRGGRDPKLPPAGVVAREKAGERLRWDFQARFGASPGYAARLSNAVHSAHWGDAVAAELHTKGSGIEVLLNGLLGRPTGTGPP